jgi:hypothetical protein
MKQYQEGGVTSGALGQSSSLSPWAGEYVTDMLGKGQALSEQPYQAYMGPLTAGASDLQTQAFQGLANLAVPTAAQTTYDPTSFTAAGMSQQYMSPYLQAALEPQIAEAQRQAEIQRVQTASRLGKAGAYGGGRQAIMEAEGQRNLLRNLADITGRGYQTAFEQAQQQFNAEQARQMAAAGQAQQYGLQALGAQQTGGGLQRAIEQQGIAADIAQFEQERDYPYKQLQFKQSLLQGLPISTQSYQYAEPSLLSNIMGGSAGILSILDAISKLGNSGTPNPGSTNTFQGTT